MDRNVTSGEELTWQERQNEYYRIGSRNIMRIINIQLIFIVILIVGLFVLVIKKENRDRYFAETAEGRKMQMTALDFPNIGKMALADWVSQAVTQVMTFGFNDIDDRFEVSRRNFTPTGWESFFKAMVASKLVEGVTKSQQIITTALLTPPELMREGLIEDVYTWEYTMKVLITFRAGGVARTDTKTVMVSVKRVPTSISPNGVGIGRWIIY